MIWLASFPRSGNTFFRIILYEVYGIESSVFGHDQLKKSDTEYTHYPVVKTHLLPHQLIPNDPDIPAIYIVRDGRDALISMAHHRKNIIAPGSDYYQNLQEAIIAAKGSFFGGWSKNVLEWSKRASIIIRFEDLIQRPIETVESIRGIIDLPEPKLEKLPTFQDLKSKNYNFKTNNNHIVLNKKGRREKFFRSGQTKNWTSEMPGDLQDSFWKFHRKGMLRLGYTEDRKGNHFYHTGTTLLKLMLIYLPKKILLYINDFLTKKKHRKK